MLQIQHLSTFDAWWQLPIDWLEPPNLERGGWSGVGRWQLSPADFSGASMVLYVKRQQNHLRTCWYFPWRGVPTFMVEFETIRYLTSQGVGVPECVFFDMRKSIAGPQAILVTRDLANYHPFSAFCEAKHMMPDAALITAVALAVKKMHAARVQHRALYPKHIFIRRLDVNDYAVTFIDLEKARRMICPAIQGTRDVLQLLSRMPDWSAEMQLRFYRAYASNMPSLLQRLGWWYVSRRLRDARNQ